MKAWQCWISHKKVSKQRLDRIIVYCYVPSTFAVHRIKLRYNLFSADVLMQKAILEVRSICESASSSSFSHYFENEQARVARFVLP